ncbi:MAG: ABC transporter ATP-binding protein [Clostridiales bacterium]|nr:ABC transporter ATP-binding protein [Clostridiales bacterium]
MNSKRKPVKAENGLPKATTGQAIRSLLQLIWQADKAYYLVLLFQAVLGAISSLVNLILPKMLIDGFTLGWDWGQFLKGILFFAALKYLVLQALSFVKTLEKRHSQLLGQKVPMVFADKVMRLHYPQLEDPQVLDLKERAIFPITNYGALQNLMGAAMDMITGLLTLGGLAAVLFAFSPWFLLALLALCVIASLLSARFSRYMRHSMQELIPTNRRYGYWFDSIFSPQFQKEYRVYGLHRLLLYKVGAYTEEITLWLKGMYNRQGNNKTLQALFTALMRVMAYGYAALRVLGGQWGSQITLGDYSVIVLATENFFATFQRFFGGVFELLASIHHLMPFCQFMLLPEAEQQDGLTPEPLTSLAFENVSFRYPHGDRQILDDISFEIKEGEKISIVGLNNAGKSTMVKLICRLFEPQSGRILWNGRDIREYNYQAYLDQLACVFQDFFLFPFTLRDNLDPEGNSPDAALHAILKEVSLEGFMARLPEGLDTHLNKAVWDDATDFSGGEKQKIAIARSLTRKSGLVILDEPTAALDPLAESEVYEHFHELTRGRTALFISHRMSSSTFCDKILLLKDGQVAAFDSHQALMKGHNLYRDLFMAQAQHFREQRGA